MYGKLTHAIPLRLFDVVYISPKALLAMCVCQSIITRFYDKASMGKNIDAYKHKRIQTLTHLHLHLFVFEIILKT